MKVLRMNGGHRFRLRHGPSDEVALLKSPEYVAFSPRGLPFLKAKVLVKEGDDVSLGQPLVSHKKNSRLVFGSPASGKVHEIRFGPRRVLEAIVIEVDPKKENVITKANKSISSLEKLTRDEIENTLLDGGLWPYLQCFPGWGVAPFSGDDSGKEIAAVHINLVRTESHLPSAMKAIENSVAEFVAGVKILSKLAPKLKIFALEGEELPEQVTNCGQVIRLPNKYPADNIGVQSFYTGALKDNQVVIGADCEIAMDIGHMFLHGQKRIERTYSIAGNVAKKPKHFRGRVGMAIGDVIDGELSTTSDVRLIAGGLFRGKKVRFQDFMSQDDFGLQAYAEDKNRIPLVFFRLGLDRFTLSRTWLAGFNSSADRDATTSNNGEERACIQCGYCIDICPVKLLPNMIMKAAVTEDIERMEYLSIHDCVDCGLCTFVCPSKIELGHAIEGVKQLIEKEG